MTGFAAQQFRGKSIIVDAAAPLGSANGAVLSLLFAEGQRPGVDSLADLAAAGEGSLPFTLSHIPGDSDNWVELLAAGLTYDCLGLAPGEPAHNPGSGALLGLETIPAGAAIALQPAPHLAEGRGMLPVVRILAGLGAELARLPGVAAIHWHPSDCWMAVDYYRRVVGNWLQGGAFPALGLTSLQRGKDGAMVSAGLALLTGQELRFEPDRTLTPAAVARVAVRLIHSLIETGPVQHRYEAEGPEGEKLVIEPVRRGRQLRVTLRQ